MAKHEHEQCSAELRMWLPPTLRDKVEQAASQEGRTVSNMARRLLERALGEREGAAA